MGSTVFAMEVVLEIASLYHQKGNGIKALQLLTTSMPVIEKNSKREVRIEGYILQSTLAVSLKDKIKYLNKAEDLATTLNHPELLWRVYYQTGVLNEVMGAPQPALSKFKSCWEIMNHVLHGIREEELKQAFMKNTLYTSVKRRLQAFT